MGQSVCVQGECNKADTMPLMLELKYEYFPATWPGRIKLLELFFAFFCLVCAAPAYWDTQHWFLFVVVVSFLGTIFFSLYYLCLAEPLNKLQVNWLWWSFGSPLPLPLLTSLPSLRCSRTLLALRLRDPKCGWMPILLLGYLDCSTTLCMA